MKKLLNLVIIIGFSLAFTTITKAAPVCVTDNVTVSSDTTTLTAGYKTDLSNDLLDETKYSIGHYQPAVDITKNVAWTDLTDAIWISDAALPSQTNQISLFQKTVDLPDEATNISYEYWLTADNAVAFYVNNELVKDYGDTYGSAPISPVYPTDYYFKFVTNGTGEADDGDVDLKFVVRNWYAPSSGNPLGLLYKVKVTYDIDSDNDGVCDGIDKCVDSSADIPEVPQGVNRWIWNGSSWQTVDPKTKDFKYIDAPYDTYGCSCTEILDKLKLLDLGEFGGHYKFGCSKSILEDFSKDMKDGELDGKYYIETVKVPANKSTATSSIKMPYLQELITSLEHLENGPTEIIQIKKLTQSMQL